MARPGPILALLGIGAVIAIAASSSNANAATPKPNPNPTPNPNPPIPPGLPGPPTGLPPVPAPPGGPIPPIGSIPSGIPTGLPDNGVAGLPEPWRTAVAQAEATASPDQLDALATGLDASGQHKAAQEVRNIANAKRGLPSGIPSTIPPGTPSGPPTVPNDVHQAAVVGFRSNPATQWTYLVVAGDSPSRIAGKILGLGNEARYIELLDANSWKPQNGETALFKRNFKSLLAGERLNIPRAWNEYIDQSGSYNGSGIPLPLGTG
jgi:hypothetical protein